MLYVDFDLGVEMTNRPSERFLNLNRWKNNGEIVDRITYWRQSKLNDHPPSRNRVAISHGVSWMRQQSAALFVLSAQGITTNGTVFKLVEQ